MRLICPNCGAQYEVADDVIPENGRDVQCSNCGHTWFEQPGASEAAEAEIDPDVSVPPPAPEPEREPEHEPEPEPEAVSKADPEPEQSLAPRPRDLDPEVADILRQEAEFERAARQSDVNPIETQQDLDLSHDPDPEPAPQDDAPADPDDDRRSREARDRLARLRGEPEIAASVGGAMAQATDAPRRELLPDIEEINSTLRADASGARSIADDENTPQARSGFRRGFVLMVVLALIALALYIFAPQISAAVPQAEGVLTAYVEWIDGLRLWLDEQVQGLVAGADDTPPEG